MEELIRQIEAVGFEMDLYLSAHRHSSGEVLDFILQAHRLSAQVTSFVETKPEEGAELLLFSSLIRANSRMLRKISRLTVRSGDQHRRIRFPQEA